MAPAMAPTDRSVPEFLSSVENPQRRADADTLIELMTEVTGEPPVLWGASIVGFGTFHYRYASGREGDAPLAGFAPRKQDLVVYLVDGYEERYAGLMERLGPHRTGKACLYLKRLGDVDLGILRTLIERSLRVARGVDKTSRAGGSAQAYSPGQ
jgi:hypothetical protein